MNSSSSRNKQLEQIVLEKEEQIRSLDKSFKDGNMELKEQMSKNEKLLIQEEKRNTYIENLQKEKETLKNKMISLENNNNRIIENDLISLHKELSARNNLISSLQGKMDLVTEENSKLKHEVDKMNNLIEELISKIESLRLEFDKKIQEKSIVNSSDLVGNRAFNNDKSSIK